MNTSTSQKPLVTFIFPELSNGGGERAFFNIAMYFYEAGTKVHILSSLNGENVKKIPAGIKLFSLSNSSNTNSSSLLKNIRQILIYLKKEKPSVVICFSDYINLAVLIAKILSGSTFKTIMSQQYHASSFINELPKKNKILLGIIQKFWLAKCNCVVAASEGVAKDITARYKLIHSSSRLKTIYNPIFENNLFALAKELPGDKNLFNNDLYKVITVGRMAPQKQQWILLEAFKLFSLQVKNAVLYIVGKGPLEGSLKSLAAELGISDKVFFIGYTANPYSYIARSNLFVLSSLYEGFGNVIIEALACGVNVVSTDCPSGPAEILNDGEFGFLCSVSNPQHLNTAMLKAYDAPIDADKLISRAGGFSIEINSKKYLQLANDLL